MRKGIAEDLTHLYISDEASDFGIYMGVE